MYAWEMGCGAHVQALLLLLLKLSPAKHLKQTADAGKERHSYGSNLSPSKHLRQNTHAGIPAGWRGGRGRVCAHLSLLEYTDASKRGCTC